MGKLSIILEIIFVFIAWIAVIWALVEGNIEGAILVMLMLIYNKMDVLMIKD